jgi:hypothetical protein
MNSGGLLPKIGSFQAEWRRCTVQLNPRQNGRGAGINLESLGRALPLRPPCRGRSPRALFPLLRRQSEPEPDLPRGQHPTQHALCLSPADLPGALGRQQVDIRRDPVQPTLAPHDADKIALLSRSIDSVLPLASSLFLVHIIRTIVFFYTKEGSKRSMPAVSEHPHPMETEIEYPVCHMPSLGQPVQHYLDCPRHDPETCRACRLPRDTSILQRFAKALGAPATELLK